jgi:hypothetical protein
MVPANQSTEVDRKEVVCLLNWLGFPFEQNLVLIFLMAVTEFQFDLIEIYDHLSQSIEELNLHSLSNSSKYCMEHLHGMISPWERFDHHSDLIPMYSNHLVLPRHEKDLIHYANILLKSSEYQRCAFLLKNRYENNLLTSSLGIFLLSYSLYLAGEKIKDQNLAEGSGNIHLFFSPSLIPLQGQRQPQQR